MDRSRFYAALRMRSSGVFGTSLSQSQVDGVEKVLDEAERRGTPMRHLSYILATDYHETGATMQPIRERGGERYLRSKPYYPWVGEGLVQVTWETNHRKFGATTPGQMMTWPIALRAIFDGMTKGMFTGKKLDDYISGDYVDYLNARRIVNGMDKAAQIAGYARAFEKALSDAGYYGALRPAAPAEAVSPDPAPPKPPTPPTASVTIPQPGSKPGFFASLLNLFRKGA
ncbi:hypothetical protein QV13_12825 [Mesorhizobium hungaricum]|jgi:hypothetical protein|uniref:Uncharacterized protein n=1 Tax=Mesorhizobium hungaricum TaxID=1566387 RepID=A0A1C2DSJ5_9HYPH|nr:MULTISPECIES: hypothetical protein [Mesorhizobium]MBN9235999.1 hypothetical protein [Mesorhizobium sp.]OCX17633.1 hypothetical protein QV13_12825 [Mesorhizobium hungaricum]